MDDALLADLRAITDAAAAADGAEPLDEGAWRRLSNHADELAIHVEPGTGMTVLDGELLHLVVAPAHRRTGVGARLLTGALAAADHAWQAWSHGDHPAAVRLAGKFGFDRVRELWVMRRPLADSELLPGNLRLTAPSLEVRGFQPGDEAELLRVNAAAFAHHPEQGRMDAEELAERMAEPWFDPADLIVAVDGARMYGFHWTKRHSATLGEVYVMAIDPETQGKGLGRTLVDVGLRHLRSVGIDNVLLYVESDNVPAVGLYEGQGFTHAAADTHVMYVRPAAAVRMTGVSETWS
jgi:mycothiol synthase